MTYPHTAGYAKGSETSQAAAESIKDVELVRAEVLSLFESGWEGTDWQLHEKLGREYETVQPRRSELKDQGLVVDTGRRSNVSRSGKSVSIWALNTHTNRRESGQDAPNGSECIEDTTKDKNAPMAKKSGILASHDSWGQNFGRSYDAEYWRLKADNAIRALGKIAFARTLEEAVNIAKAGLR